MEKDITEKTCVKCNTIKPFSQFQKTKKGKYGFNGRCKECVKLYRDIYTQTPKYKKRHREQMAKWRLDNHELFLERSRKQYLLHGKKYNAYRKEKYHNDPDFREKCYERERKYKESGRRAEMNRKPEQMAKARNRNKARRSVTEKREHDYNMCSKWREKNKDHINNENSIKIKELKDCYVASSMRVSVKDLTPEVLQTKRLIMQLKRELNNNNVKIR